MVGDCDHLDGVLEAKIKRDLWWWGHGGGVETKRRQEDIQVAETTPHNGTTRHRE